MMVRLSGEEVAPVPVDDDAPIPGEEVSPTHGEQVLHSIFYSCLSTLFPFLYQFILFYLTQLYFHGSGR
jgi:hypothetical protein